MRSAYASLSPENACTSITFGGGGHNRFSGDFGAKNRAIFRDMGARTLISPEEYLGMHFPEREPEYVRGELKQKPMPDAFHSDIQARLMQLLWGIRSRDRLRIRAEVRCQVAPDVYRLPDVALFVAGAYEQLPATPCLLAAEIVSRDEKRIDLIAKLRDCADWGVSHIWIVDPWSRRLAVWRNDTEVPVEVLTLPEYDFEVRLEQLIEGLPLD